MSEPQLEQNVERLIRTRALPPEPAADFELRLRTRLVAPRSAIPWWRLSAAAILLLGVGLFWSGRLKRSSTPAARQSALPQPVPPLPVARALIDVSPGPLRLEFAIARSGAEADARIDRLDLRRRGRGDQARDSYPIDEPLVDRLARSTVLFRARIEASSENAEGLSLALTVLELLAGRPGPPATPLNPDEARRVAGLIERLDSNSYSVRARSGLRIESYGVAALQALQGALAQERSLQSAAAVRRLIARITMRGVASMLATQKPRSIPRGRVRRYHRPGIPHYLRKGQVGIFGFDRQRRQLVRFGQEPKEHVLQALAVLRDPVPYLDPRLELMWCYAIAALGHQADHRAALGRLVGLMRQRRLRGGMAELAWGGAVRQLLSREGGPTLEERERLATAQLRLTPAPEIPADEQALLLLAYLDTDVSRAVVLRQVLAFLEQRSDLPDGLAAVQRVLEGVRSGGQKTVRQLLEVIGHPALRLEWGANYRPAIYSVVVPTLIRLGLTAAQKRAVVSLLDQLWETGEHRRSLELVLRFDTPGSRQLLGKALASERRGPGWVLDSALLVRIAAQLHAAGDMRGVRSVAWRIDQSTAAHAAWLSSKLEKITGERVPRSVQGTGRQLARFWLRWIGRRK